MPEPLGPAVPYAGELAGIAGAFTWALGSVLIRAQTRHGNVLFLNAVRVLAATVFFLILVTALGRWSLVLAIPSGALLSLFAAVVAGLVVGDTLFFKSQEYMGVARALPVSGVYPLFTLALATVFLHEPLRWRLPAGATLVTIGLYLVAGPRRGSDIVLEAAAQRRALAGIALALAAALGWACSTMLLRLGLREVDALTANVVRLPMALGVLVLMLAVQGRLGLARCYGPKALAPVVAAGILGTGLGSTFFLLSVQLAGAAKAAILSAAAPLFGATMSVLFLGERLTRANVAGVVLCVAGVWLVV
jgi:drug/metabolite transporter (DMT)-like permease